MQVVLQNRVRVYNLTAGKSLPEWLAERKKKRARTSHDERRIELIHDFEFPHFARSAFRSPNGSFVWAAGDYPPRIKCYDVNQLSLKYSFNADMQIRAGIALSPDFRKYVLQEQGRTLTIHSSAVILDRVSVPHAQRGLAYHAHSCEVLSAGSSPEIFRLSLDTGAFLESFETASSKGVNSVDYFAGQGLVLGGCDNGTVEVWDPRSSSRAGAVVVSRPGDGQGAAGISEVEPGGSVTTVCCEPSGGLLFAAGTSNGCVALYDLRSRHPLLVKDHMNSLPIVKTSFFQGRAESPVVVSADTRSIRVWNQANGTNFTAIDVTDELHDFVILKSQHNLAPPYECPDSGVICACCDTPRVQVFFIPTLGPAPRWASFLESITEELEEKDSTAVYDDFRFVTKAELEGLGIRAEDVSEGNIRPHMHGFFIENKFYRELRAFSDPTSFEEYAEGQAHKRHAAKADRTISTYRIKEEKKLQKNIERMQSDPRFAQRLSMESGGFGLEASNPEYAKLLQAVEERRKRAAERHLRYESEQFEVVEDGEKTREGKEPPHDAENESSDSEAQLAGEELRGLSRRAKRGRHQTTDAPPKGPTLFAAKTGVNPTLSDKHHHAARKHERLRKLTLEERLKRMQRKR